jgi:hypothetical protein
MDLCIAHGGIRRSMRPGATFFGKGQRGVALDRMMIQQFDQFQKLGKDNMDAAVKSFGIVSKSAQALATETADYAKRAFEQGTAAIEKLAGVRTIDKAIEIQADYLKTAYEGFVAQSNKVGELYANVAKEVFAPYEAFVGKAAK